MELGLSLGLTRGGAGGTPPFSPSDISGLELWLDASDASTITEAAGSVSQWDDKSESGYNFTQPTAARQCTTGTRTMNGLNVLDFDGDDYLQNTANAVDLFTGDATWFVVGTSDAGDDDTMLYVCNSPTEAGSGDYNGLGGGNILEVELRMDSSNDTDFLYQDGTSATGTAQSTNTDNASLLIGSYAAGGNLTSANNTSDTASVSGVPASGTYTPTRFRLGANGTLAFGQARWLNGAIAGVLMYSRVLTTAEINQTGDYLATKWGLTWTDIV